MRLCPDPRERCGFKCIFHTLQLKHCWILRWLSSAQPLETTTYMATVASDGSSVFNSAALCIGFFFHSSTEQMYFLFTLVCTCSADVITQVCVCVGCGLNIHISSLWQASTPGDKVSLELASCSVYCAPQVSSSASLIQTQVSLKLSDRLTFNLEQTLVNSKWGIQPPVEILRLFLWPVVASDLRVAWWKTPSTGFEEKQWLTESASTWPPGTSEKSILP